MNRRKHHASAAVLSIGLAAAGFGAVRAQGLPAALAGAGETAGPAAPPVQGPPEPAQTIPDADIATRARFAETQFRVIRVEARPKLDVRRIEAELPALEDAVRELQDDPSADVRPGLSSRAINDIERVWQDLEVAFSRRGKVLTDRAQDLEDRLREVVRIRQLWERTREAPDEPLPPVLAERVEQTIAAARETEKSVRERRDEVLALADGVAQRQLVIAEVLEQVVDAREGLRRRLLAKDSPPLWTALRERDRAEPLGTVFVRSLALQRAGVGEFASYFGSRLLVFAVSSVGLLALILALRRRSARWSVDDPVVRPSMRILERPLASAILLSAFPVTWLFPRAPLVLRLLSLTIALLATWRLLPSVLPSRLRLGFFAATVLFGFSVLGEVVLAPSLLQRILTLAEAGLAAGGLAMLLWPRRIHRVRAPAAGWARLAIWTGFLALAVVMTSVAANVFGRSGLARMLVSATVASACLAAVLVAMSAVLDGLWVAALRTPPLRSLNSVRKHGEILRAQGLKYLHGVFVVLWAWFTLRQFQLDLWLAQVVRDALGAKLVVRSFEISAGAVVSFALTLFAAALLSRLVRFFLDEDVLPRLPLKRGVGATISTTIHYVVVLLGFLAALAAAGIDLSRFTVLAGAFGIGLAFGLQNVVNNFVSGLILLFERPIQVGDTVQLGQVTGDVRRIGVRSSSVRTFDGAEVIVPNADLISKEVTNWTLSDRNRRIEIPIGVAYGSDPAKVTEILAKVASAHPDVLREPAPAVLFTNLGESSLDFSLRFWTSRFESYLGVRSDVLGAAYAALGEAGISIPFPQRDVHLRTVAPAAG